MTDGQVVFLCLHLAGIGVALVWGASWCLKRWLDG